MHELISTILTTKDINKKFIKFNKLRKYVNTMWYKNDNIFYPFLKFINASFEDFFNDYNIKNSVLETDNDKQTFIGILLNIYKYLLVFPNHTHIHNDKESIKRFKTQANMHKLHNKKANYLNGH
jgi:hypothetical protein